ncbi:MAG: thiolase family protein [Planctomycetes bacterium]|nr:thiolase family protein [Planctomycetota bacterium]
MLAYNLTQDGPPIVLAAGLRSPWARAGGAFKHEDAGHLGGSVARELISRTGLDPAVLDEVIVGCVGPPHDQANIARVIALRAGVPQAVPARTVARNCASGIESVTSAIANIRAGFGDAYLTMGVEVMSGYPLIMGRRLTSFFERMMKSRGLGQQLGTALSFRPSMLKPRVALLEGLTDPISGMIMGNTAELIAREFGISRDLCDGFALRSHERAIAATNRGRFETEILPHLPQGAKKGARSLDADDAPRSDQSMERLAKLRPYFEKPDGVVTVGNACGITDGAAAILVTTEAKAAELGLQPLARVRSFAWSGCDPSRMGLGPVFSSAGALDAAGCQLSDMGTIEVNEAFAAQVLACGKAFESASWAKKHLGRDRAIGELDLGKTNVNGGAIALGHPVGATGARLLLTAAHELEVGDHELALATLCIGGGQGGAVVLERIA